MRSAAWALALFALGSTAYASSPIAPECVDRCWLNSQYVSVACAADTKCLCEDADFQTAVFQCLYSQCPTSKFGTALHHALGFCAGHELHAKASKAASSADLAPAPTAAPAPALLRTEGLRKRGGNHVTKSVTKTRQSVSASAYMTHISARAIVSEMPDGQAFGGRAVMPRDANAPAAAPSIAAYRMANDRYYRNQNDLSDKDL